MTAPGAPIAPQPAWFPRTNRIAIGEGAHSWATEAATALRQPLVGGVGAHDWATAAATVLRPVPPTYKGAVAVNGYTMSIPTHAIGDLIVLYVWNNSGTYIPTPPVAGGTVPAWNSLGSAGYGGGVSQYLAYFVATATNHSTGSWSNCNGMSAVVISGQGATPIGAHTFGSGSDAANAIAPMMTLVNADAGSGVLHFFGVYTAPASWSAAPSGYTARATPAGVKIACISRNVTGSAPAVTQPHASVANGNYCAASVEIRTH